MMIEITRFAITHTRFTILLIVAAIVAGTVTYFTQPRQEDPTITIRTAQVVTRFPGLSPERMEDLVTRPIEEKIKQISEIKSVKSVTMAGLSIVTPEAQSYLNDIAPVWAELRNKIDDLKPSLPEGVIGPDVNDDYGQVAVVTLALTGNDYTMRELHEVAKDIGDRLNTLPLVSRVDLYGVQDERVWIEFDPNFMAQFGLNPATIVSAINQQNIVLPGGTVNAAGQNVVIETSGDFKTLEQIENFAIETDDGEIVYLQDLATIKRGYVYPSDAPAFYNSMPAIVVGVSMVPASNVVEVGQQVSDEMRRIRKRLPVGMTMDAVIYQPEIVRTSVHNATTNLLQTVTVVLAVVVSFLGWRSGLIVGAMVPLTMLITLIGMSLWEIELHRISIAAIIVALGLLVDNGVVIAENVRTRLDQGASRFDAALQAAGSLAYPLLTSSLTTVIAFLPLILIDDGAGEFLRSLGQVLALALITSWFLAITATPAMCYWFLPDNPAPTKETSSASESYDFYARVLNLALKNRALVIIGVVLLLFAAMQVFKLVDKRSLGPSERNQFTVYLDLPAETHIDVTTKSATQLASFLNDKDKNPEVTGSLMYVGSGGPRFFLALTPNDPQANKAFMVVNTERSEQIHAVMSRVEQFIARQLPEADGRTEILFLGESALGTVEIKIEGPDANVLRALAHRIKQVFHDIPGATAIRSDWENYVLKIHVDVDQERARRAGVSSEEIARTLSSHFDGQQITSFREGENVIPVVLRAPDEETTSIDRLRTIEVYSSSRQVTVPLLQIANFRGAVEPSKIKREDQKRALRVKANHPSMTAEVLYGAAKEQIDAIDIPEGYSLSLAGEIKDAASSNGKLFGFAPHALFLILLLLILQFNSFRRVAIILLSIPLVIIGGMFGLFAFNAYFDFTTMLGLFSLAGIIINNGIVLLDRVDKARAAAKTVSAALVEAALARVRPIIMTTITTVVGLAPLAIFGGEFWRGMAIVIMCGLSVGTMLSLIVIPVLYSIMFDNLSEAS